MKYIYSRNTNFPKSEWMGEDDPATLPKCTYVSVVLYPPDNIWNAPYLRAGELSGDPTEDIIIKMRQEKAKKTIVYPVYD